MYRRVPGTLAGLGVCLVDGFSPRHLTPFDLFCRSFLFFLAVTGPQRADDLGADQLRLVYPQGSGAVRPERPSVDEHLRRET